MEWASTAFVVLALAGGMHAVGRRGTERLTGTESDVALSGKNDALADSVDNREIAWSVSNAGQNATGITVPSRAATAQCRDVIVPVFGVLPLSEFFKCFAQEFQDNDEFSWVGDIVGTTDAELFTILSQIDPGKLLSALVHAAPKLVDAAPEAWSASQSWFQENGITGTAAAAFDTIFVQSFLFARDMALGTIANSREIASAWRDNDGRRAGRAAKSIATGAPEALVFLLFDADDYKSLGRFVYQGGETILRKTMVHAFPEAIEQAAKRARAAVQHAGRLSPAGALRFEMPHTMQGVPVGLCFTARTPVHTPRGLVAIETIALGDRVVTTHRAAGSATSVDATWRRIELAMEDPRSANGKLHVALLRPSTWIQETHARVGAWIELSLSEMQVRGHARVTSIGDPPRIEPGSGRVVLSTIESESSSVLVLKFRGTDEALEPTFGHRLFSLDRNAWVQAGKLRIGERLRSIHGESVIASIDRKPGTYTVYNFEVESEHEYLVGKLGVRSHNNNPCAPQPPYGANRAPVPPHIIKRERAAAWMAEESREFLDDMAESFDVNHAFIYAAAKRHLESPPIVVRLTSMTPADEGAVRAEFLERIGPNGRAARAKAIGADGVMDRGMIEQTFHEAEAAVLTRRVNHAERELDLFAPYAPRAAAAYAREQLASESRAALDTLARPVRSEVADVYERAARHLDSRRNVVTLTLMTEAEEKAARDAFVRDIESRVRLAGTNPASITDANLREAFALAVDAGRRAPASDVARVVPANVIVRPPTNPRAGDVQAQSFASSAFENPRVGDEWSLQRLGAWATKRGPLVENVPVATAQRERVFRTVLADAEIREALLRLPYQERVSAFVEVAAQADLRKKPMDALRDGLHQIDSDVGRALIPRLYGTTANQVAQTAVTGVANLVRNAPGGNRLAAKLRGAANGREPYFAVRVRDFFDDFEAAVDPRTRRVVQGAREYLIRALLPRFEELEAADLRYASLFMNTYKRASDRGFLAAREAAESAVASITPLGHRIRDELQILADGARDIGKRQQILASLPEVGDLVRRLRQLNAEDRTKAIQYRRAFLESAQHGPEHARVAAENAVGARGGLCFAAGTKIHTPRGLATIETVALGARVLTTRGAVASTTDVDATWRQIDVELSDPRSADGVLHIALLRSRKWIEEAHVRVGAFIDLELPEMGVRGEARVLSIRGPPRIETGVGRVVLSKIESQSTTVIVLKLRGTNETLEPTFNHKLYSLDRNTWIQAGKLHVGERLRSVHGEAVIESIARKPGTHTVYNFEVEDEHEYLVGTLGVQSHNDNPCAAAAPDPSSSFWFERRLQSAARELEERGGGSITQAIQDAQRYLLTSAPLRAGLAALGPSSTARGYVYKFIRIYIDLVSAGKSERIAFETASERALPGSRHLPFHRAYADAAGHAEPPAPTAGGWCFTAGTLVHTPTQLVAIQDIRLGARVQTRSNSFLGATAVDASWRRIELEMEDPRSADGRLHIAVLRPPAWIDRTHADIGSIVEIDMPEMQVRGPARVLSIGSAPPVEIGAGRVVLSTIESRSANVVVIKFRGVRETLEPTFGHRLFSLDRNRWIEAGKLRPGERLRSVHGEAIIESITRKPGTHTVYNFEVEDEHEYLVGTLGVQSHNDNPCAQRSGSTLVASPRTGMLQRVGEQGRNIASMVVQRALDVHAHLIGFLPFVGARAERTFRQMFGLGLDRRTVEAIRRDFERDFSERLDRLVPDRTDRHLDGLHARLQTELDMLERSYTPELHDSIHASRVQLLDELLPRIHGMNEADAHRYIDAFMRQAHRGPERAQAAAEDALVAQTAQMRELRGRFAEREREFLWDVAPRGGADPSDQVWRSGRHYVRALLSEVNDMDPSHQEIFRKAYFENAQLGPEAATHAGRAAVGFAQGRGDDFIHAGF